MTSEASTGLAQAGRPLGRSVGSVGGSVAGSVAGAVGQTRTSSRPESAATPATAVLLALFLICLLSPGYFFVGDVKLSPIRVLLLVTFLPLLMRLFSGLSGRIRGVDIFMMLYSFWIVVTLVYHHGLPRLPLAAITIVELFGGYLVGRTLVRSAADFRRLLRYFMYFLIFLSPFVLIELITDHNILQEISRKIMPTYFKGDSSYGRLGLNRVMASFEHPILYGLFCSIGFAPTIYIHRQKLGRALLSACFMGLMIFASLSSAPLVAGAIQLGLMLWARVTRSRWWLLFGLVSTSYVVVDLLSNRTPITILINYITFNPATAWVRVNIWTFGSAEMWRHPIFGIGLNDWERPNWLTGSVDNFWLLNGMRHGLPGLICVMAAAVSGFWAIARTQGLSPEVASYRTGYLLALVAMYFSLCTLHVWGGTSSFVMLFIGAGMWICDQPPAALAENGAAVGASEPARPNGPATGPATFSRFAPTHRRP